MPYAWYPSPVYAILTSGNMLRATEFRNQHLYAVRHGTLVPTVSKRSQRGLRRAINAGRVMEVRGKNMSKVAHGRASFPMREPLSQIIQSSTLWFYSGRPRIFRILGG
jgi:hypothetical protein